MPTYSLSLDINVMAGLQRRSWSEMSNYGLNLVNVTGDLTVKHDLKWRDRYFLAYHFTLLESLAGFSGSSIFKE